MRVLSVLHFPHFGGPHNRNGRIAAALAGQGVDTTIALPAEGDAAALRIKELGGTPLGIPLTRLRKTLRPMEHVRYVRAFARDIGGLRRTIREFGIDVVLVNGLMNPHAAIAAKRERVPVVWGILDNFPPAWVRHAMGAVVTHYASAILCTGRKVAGQHFDLARLRTPLVLFNPPVDLSRFSPDPTVRQSARAELGLGEKDFVIGNVANINPMKGHLTFVKAAALVKRELPNARFVLLGQSLPQHRAYMERIVAAADEAGLQVGKDFLIVDPGTRVAELAQALDVYWVTSDPRAEGISTAAEEAMALGLPVISTETGSMSEIVLDGETGFMAAPFDAQTIAERSVQMAQDADTRLRIGLAARRLAMQKFGVEACATRHLLAYRAAVGDSTALAQIADS